MIYTGRLLLTIYIPDCHSLKVKRSILKSILSKTRNQFKISAAELEYMDVWQTALLGFSIIGNDAITIRKTLQAVETFIESNWFDIQIVESELDLL
jgi:uncharacterized protein YlxP (DUF503 family)